MMLGDDDDDDVGSRDVVVYVMCMYDFRAPGHKMPQCGLEMRVISSSSLMSIFTTRVCTHPLAAYIVLTSMYNLDTSIVSTHLSSKVRDGR